MMLRSLAIAVTAIALAACSDRSPARTAVAALQSASEVRPDEIPVMVNKELPFRYPAEMYARKVQGNVVLRLYVDQDGRVRTDSTRVEETSGYPSLDSAAVKGSQELRFVPAKKQGEPMAVTILFPVYFRHPEAPPLPGDTVLQGRGAEGGGRDTTTRPPQPTSPP